MYVNKREIVFLSILSLSLSTLLIPANAAAKTGAKCNKAGITTVASGKTYTCVKSGKKLVWNKGIAVFKPIPTPAVATSVLTNVNGYLGAVGCKLANGNNVARVTQSFQQNPYRLRTTKPIHALILPIDFPDLIGYSDPQKDFAYVADGVSDYFKQLSDGKSIINWTIYPRFIRYGTKVADARLGGRTTSGYGTFSTEAMNLAKQTVDISTYDLIVYAPPLTTTRNQIAIGPAFVSESPTKINATMLDAQSYEMKNPLTTAHEIGHLMGLADLYNFEAANEAAAQKSIGAQFQQFTYMGIFDLMNNVSGNGVELTAWNRWLIDFITDDQIRCLPPASTTTLLTPVEVNGGIKGAVIPLSTTEAIVLESRRAIRYDKNLGKSSEGVLVYKVNTSISSGSGPMRVIGRPQSAEILLSDAPLKLNESLILDGYIIKVIESGSFGDVIKVEKGA